MANGQRGEVELVVMRRVNVAAKNTEPEWEDKEKTYTLKLSMNAAASLESSTKKTFTEMLAAASDLSFIAIRQIVWMLLQKFHAREFPDVQAAGELIDDAGGVAMFFDKLKELVDVNKPPTDAKGEGGANPPNAPVSTGASSIN